ncbi:MAG TPA: ribosome maturation factor RimP [Gammaproteobacteria bacterium]|nr:ribosome maturation factor RimP [Gammaproteobacteria bacterium]
MRERLLGLLEPAVEALGYELVELEFHGQGGGSLLRLYIDKAAGVTVDDCEQVSRQVSAVLDVEDPLPGAYTLEVSSPGLDRPLRKQADYARFAGRQAKLELALPRAGRRRYTGTLKGLESDAVLIEVDGEMQRLPLAEIAKARLVPEYKF